MKKIIILLVAIISISNIYIYAQEECVEFDTVWVSGFNMSSYISKIDENGYIYIVGNYSGNSAIIGNYTLPTVTDPSSGACLAKFDSTGNMLWVVDATNGVSAGKIDFREIEIDNLGNIYLLGNYNGTINFQGNALTSALYAASPYRDGFVAKLNNTGQVQWIETQTGASHYKFKANTSKTTFYLISTLYESVPAIFSQDTFNSKGAYDILITKMNNHGMVQFVKHVGGKGAEELNSISIDDNENIYISGTFTDTSYFDTITLIPAFTSSGNHNIYLAKMNSQGIFDWVIQTKANTITSAIVTAYHSLGVNNNIFVYGMFNGSIDFGSNNILNSSSKFNAYISEYNIQGQVVSTTLIANSDSSFHLIDGSVDSNGILYLIGNITGNTNLLNRVLPANNYDLFIAKFRPFAGEGIDIEWLLQSSGNGDERGRTINVLSTNYIYISGLNNNGIAEFGNLQLNYTSELSFIAKISECESSNINTPNNPLSQISIYPNPANTQISISNLPANSTVNISDISGRVIYTQQTKNNTLQIPTTEWSSGMYLVSVSSNGVVEHRKVAVW